MIDKKITLNYMLFFFCGWQPHMFVRSRHSCIGAGTAYTSTQTTEAYTCTAIRSVHVYSNIICVHLYTVKTVFCLFTSEEIIFDTKVIKIVNFCDFNDLLLIKIKGSPYFLLSIVNPRRPDCI